MSMSTPSSVSAPPVKTASTTAVQPVRKPSPSPNLSVCEYMQRSRTVTV
jgi:hypothetical protein